VARGILGEFKDFYIESSLKSSTSISLVRGGWS